MVAAHKINKNHTASLDKCIGCQTLKIHIVVQVVRCYRLGRTVRTSHLHIHRHINSSLCSDSCLSSFNTKVWYDTVISAHEITSYVAMWSAMAQPGIVAILFDNFVHNPVGQNKSSTYHCTCDPLPHILGNLQPAKSCRSPRMAPNTSSKWSRR